MNELELRKQLAGIAWRGCSRYMKSKLVPVLAHHGSPQKPRNAPPIGNRLTVAKALAGAAVSEPHPHSLVNWLRRAGTSNCRAVSLGC